MNRELGTLSGGLTADRLSRSSGSEWSSESEEQGHSPEPQTRRFEEYARCGKRR